MKNRITGFISGVLVAVLLFGTSLAAFGEAIAKKVEIFYKDIKICIDGSYIEPKDADGNKVEPFVMDGTTYLPVRAVANAFGKDVEWDGATSTVFLGAKPGENKYSRTNPAPIGTAQSIQMSTNNADFSEIIKYNATVAIEEVYRGEEAWNILKEANRFNSEAKEGKEYVLIKVNINVSELNEDNSANISQAMFNFYSTDYTKYTGINLNVMPDNKNINTTVYDGANVSGYVCQEVEIGDATPTVAFGQDIFGSGGIWFSLTK